MSSHKVLRGVVPVGKHYIAKHTCTYTLQDGQWADLEYMFEKFVFSYDRRTYPGLPELVDDLHKHHQKFVVIVVSKYPDSIHVTLLDQRWANTWTGCDGIHQSFESE